MDCLSYFGQKMKEISWSYLAGLVDHRSWVGIQRINGKHWVNIVRIHNKDKAFLEKIVEFTGCGYIVHRGKNSSSLVITHKKAVKFLYGVYPFLSAKREHAEIIFAMQRVLDSVGERGGPRRLGQRFLTDAEVEARIVLYERMKKLNQ